MPKGNSQSGKTNGENSVTEDIRNTAAHEDAKKHIGKQKSDMWSGFAAGFWKGVTCGAANLNKSFQSYEAETKSQVSFWEAYNKNEKAGSLVGSLLLSAVIAAGITKVIGGATSSNGGGAPSAGTSAAGGGIGAGIGAFGLSAELQLGLATAGMTIAVAAGAAIQQASGNQESSGLPNSGAGRGESSSSKYLEELDNLSDNKINHIINGSKGSNHGWEKLVPDKNWNDIKNIIANVMDTGSEGSYKTVFSKKAIVNGHEVEVTYTKLNNGMIRISDAWVNY